MIQSKSVFIVLFGVMTLFLWQCSMFKSIPSLRSESFSDLKNLFQNPPSEYRTVPFWVWNDEITETQIDEQLSDFKSKGFGGVFVHPRPGLITPYISERWHQLFKFSVEKGKELGLDIWIYDENSYPSGFAGGHVPAQMPESYNQGQGLQMQQVVELPENTGDYFIILKQDEDGFSDITNIHQNDKGKTGIYYIFEKSYYQKSGWYGGFSYVDLLKKGVTEKFIDITMKGYTKSSSADFGHTVSGIFTDEPQIAPPGGMRWTPELFDTFKNMWGYDLIVQLPSLWLEKGDWKRIRHNYYQTLLHLFINRWSKPWSKYCEENNLKWTGHYWEHEWPNPRIGPDNMAMYAWHQVPGIDILMNQYSENVHAQFGNVRAVKELSSIANQLGKEQTLSETYGASGWDLSFEDMKRIADWQYVFGVNLINQHLSYATIKGSRKHDHPPSFSYHEPWWSLYNNVNDYCARMTLVMTSGEQINKILVIEPTTTAWMYFSDKSNKAYSNLGQRFQDFLFELEKYHIEYDLGSEQVIELHGEIEDSKFIVGNREYDLIILPPGFENVNGSTYKLIEKYLADGGIVVSFEGTPEYIDGKKADAVTELISAYKSQWNSAQHPEDVLDLLREKDFRIETTQGKVFHHRRQLKDGQIILIVNSSKTEWAKGNLNVKGKSVFLLETQTGAVQDYPQKTVNNSTTINFDIPPVGELVLYISASNMASKNLREDEVKINILEQKDKVAIERIALNSLILDYCDLEFDDGSGEKGIYYFQASDQIFKHFGLNGNPWNRAVQYKTNILDKDDFPEDSGFRISFPFFIEKGTVTSDLKIVIERPGLWTVTINGHPVSPNSDEFWLDKEFRIYDIGNWVKSGENRITLHAVKMTIHTELEPIYLLGDFSLTALEAGWSLGPSMNLKMSSWNQQGMPFYSHEVKYSQDYQITKMDSRYILHLPEWNGVVARVNVNGIDAGIIGWQPDELDISDFVSVGENEISVSVFGSLKNLLGPHHNNPPTGAAWPGNFESAPQKQPAGHNYDVLEYGLRDNFKLIEYKGPGKKNYSRYYKAADPVIKFSSKIIKDKPVKVELSTSTPGSAIYYTSNGSDPTIKSDRYESPILINKKTSLRAIALKKGMLPSIIINAEFEKVNFLNAKYKNEYSFKHPGGGDTGLFDGHRGGFDYKDGYWQGYEEDDLEITLELIKLQEVNKISAGFLQDIGSWIYFPATITFFVSQDGENYKKVAYFNQDEISKISGERIKNISAMIRIQKVKYIKIIANNIGTCPKGDPGDGGRAWLFVDEILVN